MLSVRKDVLEPGKTGLSQSKANGNHGITMPGPNNSTLVRTPSVRELCKAKAVKYSRKNA